MRAEEMIMMGLQVEMDAAGDTSTEAEFESIQQLIAAIERVGDLATTLDLLARAAEGAGDVHEGAAAGRCTRLGGLFQQAAAVLRVDR